MRDHQKRVPLFIAHGYNVAMELRVCQDKDELSEIASLWVKDRLAKHPHASLFLPAGETPKDLYRLWEKERPAWLKGVPFLQVDEIISKAGRGRFLSFLHKELHWLKDQIIPVSSPLPPGPFISVLGLGLNGHVAFHEPGLPPHFEKGEVELEATTCESLQLPKGSVGLTYGVGTFSKSVCVSILVSGKKKKSILKKLLSKDITLPATRFFHLEDFTIFADPDAV